MSGSKTGTHYFVKALLYSLELLGVYNNLLEPIRMSVQENWAQLL